MGQQQLLLVILVTIIVGIATVVALNTFSSAAEAAMIDAVRLDLLSAGGAAQGYYMRPVMLGGGGRTYANVDFRRFAFPGRIVEGSDNLESENENATYVISGQSQNEFLITGTISGSLVSLSARVCPNGLKMGKPGIGVPPAPDACN